MSQRLFAAVLVAACVSSAAFAAPAKAGGARAARLVRAVEDRGRARSRRRTVAFTTDEATWLHLDVHPDGSQVVFSLLGDLYLLPIAGGEAKRITSGAAYDVQPRFSPDGKWIAFASDRGGIENLWVCDLDGEERAAGQHREGAHGELARPGRPTATYLVGRKRLTDTSRLGTVELWMWHVKGGEGVQLTKKDEQPDAADPAFSPDGRFIFFSAREARYRYDRNVNDGHLADQAPRPPHRPVACRSPASSAARRRPRLRPTASRWPSCGACAPRRVLEVHGPGRPGTRAAHRGRRRARQPGGLRVPRRRSRASTGRRTASALVATRRGHSSGATTRRRARAPPFPSRAAVEQRVTDACASRGRSAADTVRARIVRWPVEIARRQAPRLLGGRPPLRRWTCPAGTPRRLTTAPDLEYAPAFSADGTQLAFVTWNDARGRPRVGRADGRGRHARAG